LSHTRFGGEWTGARRELVRATLCSLSLAVAYRKDREERLLRYLDAADGLHPLLACLLLLEQLLFR
jgi:hypothetical protein